MSNGQRFTALDVFRGMTVCFMIIVNNQYGPEAYAPLEHADWHGFTPTDLVFPSFLFAVGNAMAFTMPRMKDMAGSAVSTKILKRTLLIFIIGYLLSWSPFFNIDASGVWTFRPLEKTRIFGVLQRIALCFGIASFMIYALPKKAVYVASGLFLLGYWFLLYVGGDYTMLGNIGTTIDKWLVSENHMYKGEGVAFDPEGFLSTFPSVVNVVIGYYAGVLLREKGKDYEAIAKVVLAGAVMMAIAYCWNYMLPINKKLWTGSFVLYTCGIDLMLIGLLVYILDKTNVKKGWTYFFEVFGRNPLFIYVLSGLIPDAFSLIRNAEGQDLSRVIAMDGFQSISHGAFGTLLYSLAMMLTCWTVGYFLDKRKIYIRV